MRILIIQENGRHLLNRSYRECHSLSWSFHALGHKPMIWGLGHSNFQQAPDFNAFDIILNLENYDQSGWLPELKRFQKPIKMLWAVDEHVQPLEYYKSIFDRDGCDYWLHSTRDYVKHPEIDIWMPNAVDPILVRPLGVRKRAEIGFCGHVHNRAEWMHALHQRFEFRADVGVIGRKMVEAINSYEIAFNRNIANDINARNFEVTACGIPLLTGTNPQYEPLGFKNEQNCMFYESKEELLDKTAWLLKNETKRDRIGKEGLRLSQAHTYTQRARMMLELAERSESSLQVSMQRKTNPKVSVCIITNAGLPEFKQRIQLLKRLIRSISHAGFPEQPEIIVAGAVPEELVGVVRLNAEEEARDGQVCNLRNLAFKRASGEIIIHCDDDVLFTPDYWKAVSEKLAANDADIICTRLLNPNGTRYWDWAAIFPGKGQTLLPYDVSDGIIYATGGHGVYRRHVFDKVRWSEHLKHGSNEEFDFAQQAHRAGFRYGLCPKATVYLQYFHCDADAAVNGTAPAGDNETCAEFRSALRLCAGEPSTARNRFAHKITAGAIKLSILVGCYKYLQRFRIFAQSIASQDFELSGVEVLVANPNSPDGLADYLRLLLEAFPNGPHFREVPIEETHYRNRGYMVQRAFEASRGKYIIGMDCDLVLPPDFLCRLLDELQRHPDCVIGVYRKFLSQITTARILTGAAHPILDFSSFEGEDGEEAQGYRGILGYCQAVERRHWESVSYPEEYDSIAISDVKFNERLQAIGVRCRFLRDLEVLHLHHSRDWQGTKIYL